MSINENIANIESKFQALNNWEERYKLLIDLGKDLQPMPPEYQIENNKVRGCQSQVWLFAEYKNGKIIFFADSDASIVKGIISLLLKVFSNSAPLEILQVKFDFLDSIGLKQHLSMNRANGLASMIKQIKIYALAFSTQEKSL